MADQSRNFDDLLRDDYDHAADAAADAVQMREMERHKELNAYLLGVSKEMDGARVGYIDSISDALACDLSLWDLVEIFDDAPPRVIGTVPEHLRRGA